MTAQANAVRESRFTTVRIPLEYRRRGGRKLVIAPEGAQSYAAPRAQIDNSLVKALARAFRWRKLLEESVCATVSEIAEREKINRSYVCRVLRLTLLAPEIVEMILSGRQPASWSLATLMRPFAATWGQQVKELGQ